MKKNRNRGWTGLLLCAMLVISLLGSAAAAPAAAGTLQLEVQAPMEEAGFVTIPVAVIENPGYTNYELLMDYDRTALEFVELADADPEKQMVNDSFPVSQEDGIPALTGKTCLYVSRISQEAVTGTGTFLQLKFKVLKQNAVPELKLWPLTLECIDKGVQKPLGLSLSYAPILPTAERQGRLPYFIDKNMEQRFLDAAHTIPAEKLSIPAGTRSLLGACYTAQGRMTCCLELHDWSLTPLLQQAGDGTWKAFFLGSGHGPMGGCLSCPEP